MLKFFRRAAPPLDDGDSLYPRVLLDYEEFARSSLENKGPIIYTIRWRGVEYDFLASRRKGSERATIFGSGDFDRRKIVAPYFARHSWHSLLRENALWYFDPDCREGAATLRWCYGVNDDWRLPPIAELIRIFLDKWRVTRSLYFGSSGGGFTAIALACLSRGRAAVINPQFFCLNFWPAIVRRFREAVLEPGQEIIAERADIIKLINKEGYCPPLKIVQNLRAERDMETQVLPFLAALKESPVRDLPVTIEFYALEGGHKAMPDQDFCLRLIRGELDKD